MLIKKLTFLLYAKWVQLKCKFLWRYYGGLSIQAQFLYQQSPLFKYRWQELGLNFARESYDRSENDQLFFFNKARKEPFKIRWQIFLDAITGKEPRPYYLNENN